jgi:uncharacterized RDD family membrane protein YckC
VREIVTPEGVPLRFPVARVTDRAAAFLLDAVIVAVATVAVVFLIVLTGVHGVTVGLGLVALFVLRNFYFTWFECRWQGSTPGKRSLGLRVIDARGGPLTGEAVFARNLMREVELFVPLMLVLGGSHVWPGAPGWARVLAAAWPVVIAALPLLNRDRLRAGDLVAGTMVVLAPKAVLLEDLAAASPGAVRSEVAFTDQQLDVYGIYELQVLEELLRQAPETRAAACQAVAEKIRRKIRWTGPAMDAEAFLRAFYNAQRKRLEQRMLLGERRESKKEALTRRP